MRGGSEHQVALYANDLLLFISNSSKSLPAIMSTLGNVGIVSGYKLNLSKSTLFIVINPKARQSIHTLNSLPFANSNQFKYLVINITEKLL